MTWQDVAVRLLLAFGVIIEVLCCMGLLVMRSTFDRLHFLGPATILGVSSIALAVVIAEALSQAGIKAIVILLVLLIASPVLGHVTARVAYLRQYGNLHMPEEAESR